jgi:hypothetical protein
MPEFVQLESFGANRDADVANCRYASRVFETLRRLVLVKFNSLENRADLIQATVC